MNLLKMISNITSKRSMYILGFLFCLYGLNNYLDIFLTILISIICFLNSKNEDFYCIYFGLIFFEHVLVIPYVGGSYFRIYEIFFAIKILYDIYKKKLNLKVNLFCFMACITIVLTSLLYFNFSSFVSLLLNVIMLFYAFSDANTTKDFYNKLFKAIAIFAFFSVIFGIFRGVRYDYGNFNRIAMTISDPNYSALLLNFGLFASIRAKFDYKIEQVILVSILVLGLILTISLSGILCFLILILLLIFQKNKKSFLKILICMSVLFCILLIIPIPENNALHGIQARILHLRTLNLDEITSGRLTLSINYLKYFIGLPIINVLFGGLNITYEPLRHEMLAMFKTVSHNSLIDILYFTGILGFILIIGLLLYKIIFHFKEYKKNGNNEALTIIVLSLVLLYFSTNLSIFPYKYFVAFYLFTGNTDYIKTKNICIGGKNENNVDC